MVQSENRLEGKRKSRGEKHQQKGASRGKREFQIQAKGWGGRAIFDRASSSECKKVAIRFDS